MEVLHVLRGYLTKHVLLWTQLPHGISVIGGRERGQLSEVNSLKTINIVFWKFFFFFSFYIFPFTFSSFPSLSLLSLSHFPCDRDNRKSRFQPRQWRKSMQQPRNLRTPNLTVFLMAPTTVGRRWPTLRNRGRSLTTALTPPILELIPTSSFRTGLCLAPMAFSGRWSCNRRTGAGKFWRRGRRPMRHTKTMSRRADQSSGFEMTKTTKTTRMWSITRRTGRRRRKRWSRRSRRSLRWRWLRRRRRSTLLIWALSSLIYR